MSSSGTWSRSAYSSCWGTVGSGGTQTSSRPWPAAGVWGVGLCCWVLAQTTLLGVGSADQGGEYSGFAGSAMKQLCDPGQSLSLSEPFEQMSKLPPRPLSSHMHSASPEMCSKGVLSGNSSINGKNSGLGVWNPWYEHQSCHFLAGLPLASY